MKANRTVFAVFFPGVVSALCLSLTAVVCIGAGTPQPPQPPDPNVQAVVVARIGDLAITREDLAKRLLQEIQPHEEEFSREAEPVTAEGVLRKMIAEKATSMEGRRLGLLQDEQIHAAIAQSEQQLLVRRLRDELLKDLSVDESEIGLAQKNNPKATPEQAKMLAQNAKGTQILGKFYAQLIERRKLTKVTENLAKAAAIHQRLLLQPVTPRGPGESWIRNSQVINELSEDEKKLVLATYEGGQFTLKDWFQTLCNMAPPRRPAGLDKPQGVERLLDLAVGMPVLAVEAKARGYDKDPKLRSEVRTLEDARLLYKVQEEKTKGIKEPTADQVKAEFEKDPQRFATQAMLKIDQIWCENLETARKVKGMLDEGADFRTVKKDHSLQKDVESYTVSSGSEGPFWADLRKGEPNEIVGPVQGFYDSGARWRVVKIIEKTSAKVQSYSDQLGASIKWVIYGDQRQCALRDYEKELLAKYPHEVFSGRIKDMDPLELAMKPQDRR